MLFPDSQKNIDRLIKNVDRFPANVFYVFCFPLTPASSAGQVLTHTHTMGEENKDATNNLNHCASPS